MGINLGKWKGNPPRFHAPGIEEQAAAIICEEIVKAMQGQEIPRKLFLFVSNCKAWRDMLRKHFQETYPDGVMEKGYVLWSDSARLIITSQKVNRWHEKKFDCVWIGPEVADGVARWMPCSMRTGTLVKSDPYGWKKFEVRKGGDAK
jgi:hypothetical protein